MLLRIKYLLGKFQNGYRYVVVDVLSSALIHNGHARRSPRRHGYNVLSSYFVIDREGSIRYKSVGFPGVSKIKDELKKELNK